MEDEYSEDEYHQYEEWSRLDDPKDQRIPRYRMYGILGDEEEGSPLGILVAMVILSFAILARYLSLKVPFLAYQIFLLVICVFVAAIFQYSTVLDDYQDLLKVTASQYEILIMPLLIMRITLMTDFHCVMRSMPQILLISVPRFIIEFTSLGILMTSVVSIGIAQTEAIMFGLVVSPIYPSTIIALVKDLSTSKHLGTIIEMETLITIAISKTLYTLLLAYNEEIMIYWYQYILYLIRDCVGGILFGCIFGRLATLMLNFFHSEPIWAIIFHVSLAYFVYLFMYLLGTSGYIGVIVVGMYLANERPKLTQDVEKSILYFWECAYHVIYTIAYVPMHVLAILIFFQKSTERYYASIVVLYLTCNICRFFTFLLMYPLLKRLGYSLNKSGLLVLSFTNTKDIPNMIFAMDPYYHTEMRKVSIIYITHVLLLEVISLLINCTCMSTLMQLLGLSDVSLQRRTNMNNCLKFIWKKRALYLPLLKYNRFYAAANWDAINQATIIKHPYMLKLSLDDEEEDSMNVEATCPDCNRTFYMEKNTAERLNVIKEVYTRIVKAQRVLYIRLYENGLLSKESKWLLLYMLEATKDSKVMEFKTTDFENFINIPNLLKLSKILKPWRVEPDKEIVAPKHPKGEICYYIEMHVCFIPFLYLLITIQTILAIVNEVMEYVGMQFIIYYTIRIVLLLFFWLEVVIKVFSRSHKNYYDGLKAYFRVNWLKLVFVLLLFLTAKMCISYISYYPLEEQPIYFGITIVQIKSNLDYIDWVFTIRYLRVTRYFLKYCALLVEAKIDRKYSDGYDLGKAIVTGDTELLDMITTLVDDDRIRHEIMKNLEARREKVNNILSETAKQRPSIAVSVKTKQAVHSILNIMRQSMQELRQAGYIDSIEYQKLSASLEKLVNNMKGTQVISPSSPKILFKEIPWMGHRSDIVNFFYENVVIRTYDINAPVMEKGRVADGIYVVVTGLLKLKYVPMTEIELMSADIGAILIIDYLSSLQFGDEIDDFIVAGNSIGELSFLTGRPYSCTVTADSPVQIYHISVPILKAAIREFNDPVDGLVPSLWKASCFQLATMLLLSTPMYQFHTPEQLQEYVERAFVPDLSEIQILVLNDLIQDVLLLDGLLADCVSREIYVPPYYIPRVSQKLFLNKEYSNVGSKIETRLMLIPIKDVDPTDVMIRLHQIAEIATKELLSTIRLQVKKKTTSMKKLKKHSMGGRDTSHTMKTLVSGARIGGTGNAKDSATGTSIGLLNMGTMMNQGVVGVSKKKAKSSKNY